MWTLLGRDVDESSFASQTVDADAVIQAEKCAVKVLTADGGDRVLEHTEEQTCYAEEHELRLDSIKTSLR